MRTHDEAMKFLQMHGGSCSVLLASTYGRAFVTLEISGEVKIKPSGTTGFVDIYHKSFKPRFAGKGDN